MLNSNLALLISVALPRNSSVHCLFFIDNFQRPAFRIYVISSKNVFNGFSRTVFLSFFSTSYRNMNTIALETWTSGAASLLTDDPVDKLLLYIYKLQTLITVYWPLNGDIITKSKQNRETKKKNNNLSII